MGIFFMVFQTSFNIAFLLIQKEVNLHFLLYMLLTFRPNQRKEAS